jgi:hypothetical protein
MTTILFTGETRESPLPDGTAITYWGGTAVVAGRSIRALSLQASPEPPGYSCGGMLGIECLNDDTTIEDVRVFISEADTRPSGRPWAEGGFWYELIAEGIEITIRRCRFERGDWNGAVLLSCSGLVDRIESDDAIFKARGSTGLSVQGSTFGSNCDLRLSGDVVFARNQVESVIYATGPQLAGGPPVRGPHLHDNQLQNAFGLALGVTGTVVVEDNLIEGYYGFDCGGNGAAVIRRNEIRPTDSTMYLMRLGSPASPIIEANEFWNTTRAGRLVYRMASNAILIETAADFGGGRSRGGNHFSPIYHVSHAGPPIKADAPGLTVLMSDNFWRDPESFRWQIEISEGTTVITDRPRADPLP